MSKTIISFPSVKNDYFLGKGIIYQLYSSLLARNQF